MTTPRRRQYDDPLNPWQDQTREEHMANRSQRNFDTAVDTRASQQDRATALRTTTGLPGAVPRSATRGSPMSAYDRAEQVRRNALLPGAKPTALTGPATAQNTGVTGVKASTPDFGSTRRLPGGGTETFMPDSRGGRYVGSVANPPPRTDSPRPKATSAPLNITPPNTESPAAGVRTVAIDPKYQAPGGPATGTSVEQWRHDLMAQHPEIFKAGTPENLAFVAAHKNEDGSMRPIDGTKALGIANQVKAKLSTPPVSAAVAENDALGAPRIKGDLHSGPPVELSKLTAEPQPRVTTNGANNPPVTPSATPTAIPRVTTRTDPPVATEPPKPLLRRGLEGIADTYSAGTDLAKGAARSVAGKGLEFLEHPAESMTRGLVDSASKVGSAVAPYLLTPGEQKSVGGAASALGRGVIGIAKGGDAVGGAMGRDALTAPLKLAGAAAGLETDEEKRRKLGLP